MRGNKVYLEAPGRTQELLNVKWTLKSAGLRIGSTWHEVPGSASGLSSKDHWNAKGVERLQACDLLVVICGKNDRSIPEMAMMAGLALGHGLQVVWIGRPVGGLNAFGTVWQFNTTEDYERTLRQHMYSQPPTVELVAA
jgi:hypothetical protein